jgi:hypothetical protein
MSDNITRQNIPQDPRNPKSHLDSGYEDAPADYTIPSCGIEDCDFSLFDLFDKTIPFTKKVVRGSTGPLEVNRPTVILATGERFAVVKRLRPPRDKNTKALILPAISIRRTAIEQSAQDITSRGMNQFTGNIIIKRKLNEQDKDYQRVVNKLGHKNLQTDFPTTTRETGDFASDPFTMAGGLLEPHLHNNIFEIISIPQPQFFTATYEVVFWTGYSQHMNYLVETLMSSFLPQGKTWKLQTDKGYWFMAGVEESFQGQENFDDFKEEERIIRYTFTVKVRGYLLAPSGPSDQVPVRRWISAPNLVFETIAVNSDVQRKKTIEQIYGSTDTRFALTELEVNPTEKQTPTSNQQVVFQKSYIDRKTGRKSTRYVSRLESNNIQGETVFYASDPQALEEFFLSLK